MVSQLGLRIARFGVCREQSRQTMPLAMLISCTDLACECDPGFFVSHFTLCLIQNYP